MTSKDHMRCLILMGYAAARLGDGQFERAIFVLAFGALLILASHAVDPWLERLARS